MRHDAPEYYYHTRVKRGPSGLHDTWLILGGEAFDNHTVPDDEKLSLSLTAPTASFRVGRYRARCWIRW